MIPNLFMVFDVESIGLHGEGFAFGFVVVDQSGAMMEEACEACFSRYAIGSEKNRLWVSENIPTLPSKHRGPEELRASFWGHWQEWKERGAVLVADCCWPVEARFLAACIDDYPTKREWQGPYPLHDLASVLLALGEDPLAIRERLPDEVPVHDPLADARQSARLLVDALKRCRGRVEAA